MARRGGTITFKENVEKTKNEKQTVLKTEICTDVQDDDLFKTSQWSVLMPVWPDSAKFCHFGWF